VFSWHEHHKKVIIWIFIFIVMKFDFFINHICPFSVVGDR
jgi:hypothetical protein